ncbi:PA1571 family protein [Marinobacter sp. X15-166B]|uniref:PA1571 family protein n=1 Tax=Marinobacter sp. X15-166B TaxID=1897620 RepID=UPI001301604E|nr:PA1571 family protein [Marinobacter sp. X15-166B]
MTEGSAMLQQKHDKESGMNGAAIVLPDGREVPITDTMVRQSLEALDTPPTGKPDA